MRATSNLFHVTARLFVPAFAILAVYEDRALAGWPDKAMARYPMGGTRKAAGGKIHPLKSKIYVEA